jgi:PAS domain S-box-containing protein
MVTGKELEYQNKIAVLVEDLSSLEAYAKELFSFSPLPICFISPMGLILEANPAFEKISGKTMNDIIGEPVEKFFNQDELKSFLMEIEEKGFSSVIELSFFLGENKIIVGASGRARKNQAGEFIGYFLGFFDLTDIKKKEYELDNAKTALLNILEDTEDARRKIEEEKNKTAAVIANLTDGLIVIDEGGRISMVNPKALEIFDIAEKDTVGVPFKKAIINTGLKSLGSLFNKNEKEFLRKELKLNENLIIDVSFVNITKTIEKGKRKTEFIIIIHDITREKIIEKLKTEFVSISAHQLRTPLSAIKWTLQMLLEGDLGSITEEQKEFIEKINISNERMILLINDLLNVARIEEGRYVYQTVPFDIAKVIDSVINLYKDVAKRKGINFEFLRPKEDIPKVKIDVEKMTLAITNLVDNAVKYTPKGGFVKISIKKNKGMIEFSVQDSGIGIPAGQKERVFGKFFRAANALKKETEGSGLGNFIVKNIIEAHDGKIWFESEENKGSTFYFTLPINK